jgi:hypothetical protein
MFNGCPCTVHSAHLSMGIYIQRCCQACFAIIGRAHTHIYILFMVFAAYPLPPPSGSLYIRHFRCTYAVRGTVSFPVKILRSIVPDIVSPGRGRGEALTPGIKYSPVCMSEIYQICCRKSGRWFCPKNRQISQLAKSLVGNH